MIYCESLVFLLIVLLSNFISSALLFPVAFFAPIAFCSTTFIFLSWSYSYFFANVSLPLIIIIIYSDFCPLSGSLCVFVKNFDKKIYILHFVLKLYLNSIPNSNTFRNTYFAFNIQLTYLCNFWLFNENFWLINQKLKINTLDESPWHPFLMFFPIYVPELI